AAITGWGACMPPAVLSNHDLSTFLDTSDEWITSRTGMKERRVSHVAPTRLATVAAHRALACAGLAVDATELIVYASCSNDEPGGVLGEQLGCAADARESLRVRGMGCAYANRDVTYGDTEWDFDGQEIFRRAVQGMTQASRAVLEKCGVPASDVDLVVPHQA